MPTRQEEMQTLMQDLIANQTRHIEEMKKQFGSNHGIIHAQSGVYCCQNAINLKENGFTLDEIKQFEQSLQDKGNEMYGRYSQSLQDKGNEMYGRYSQSI